MGVVIHKNVSPIIRDEEFKKQTVVDTQFIQKSQKIIFMKATFIFITFLSILLILLGFQNYQLRQKLSQKSSESPVPTQTEKMPEKQNWSLFARGDLGFSIQLPLQAIISEGESCIFMVLPKDANEANNIKEEVEDKKIADFELIKKGQVGLSFCKTSFKKLLDLAASYQNININDFTLNTYKAFTADELNLIGVESPSGKIIEIKYFFMKHSDKELVDSILSTFKFLSEPPQIGEATTQNECEEKGGVWQAWGSSETKYCQIPAADGGEICYDGGQCSLGKCISYENKVPGECQTYKNTFGCFSYIENGRVGSAICID